MNAISGAQLVVGLVNNMPPAAFAAAEEQFRTLLQLSCDVRLRCFAPMDRLPPNYEPLDSLWNARLDALIVTGTEPQADEMRHEPSAPILTRLVDWASEHTRTTIWSCLAAHAAVFRLDGIERYRLPEKLSGVFTCRRSAATALLDSAPAEWPVPHSRINDLDVAALRRAGYTILSQGPGESADTFAKHAGRSNFFMLHGHPEYAADTLLREYRRDLRRWRAGAPRPRPPANYFDAPLDALLTDAPDPEAGLAAIQSVREPAPHWQPHGIRLFRTWLTAMQRVETGLSRA